MATIAALLLLNNVRNKIKYFNYLAKFCFINYLNYQIIKVNRLESKDIKPEKHPKWSLIQ